MLLLAWTAVRSTDELVAIMREHQIPCAPILDMPEVVASPQVAARDMLLTVNDPIVGERRVVGDPIKIGRIDPRQPLLARVRSFVVRHAQQGVSSRGYDEALAVGEELPDPDFCGREHGLQGVRLDGAAAGAA